MYILQIWGFQGPQFHSVNWAVTQHSLNSLLPVHHSLALPRFNEVAESASNTQAPFICFCADAGHWPVLNYGSTLTPETWVGDPKKDHETFYSKSCMTCTGGDVQQGPRALICLTQIQMCGGWQHRVAFVSLLLFPSRAVILGGGGPQTGQGVRQGSFWHLCFKQNLVDLNLGGGFSYCCDCCLLMFFVVLSIFSAIWDVTSQKLATQDAARAQGKAEAGQAGDDEVHHRLPEPGTEQEVVAEVKSW